MTPATPFRLDCVAVAVAFDHHTLGLVSAAAALCARLRKPLCLLHVIEPWMERDAPRSAGETDVLWNTAMAVETNARALALSRMDELVSQIPPGLTVRQVVASGKLVQTLCRETQLMGAGLLLIGAGAASESHWTSGYSTAMAASAASAVPVAVIDRRSARGLFREHPSLIVADDLGPATREAAAFGFGLAAALGDGEVTHLHVTGITLEALDAGLTSAVAASHTPIDPAAAAETHRALLRALRDRLESCSVTYRSTLADADCLYTPLVVAGKIYDSLADVVNGVDPDVVIFGRHKLIHTEPFFLGRLPMKSMLRLGRTIIVVPTA